MGIARIMKTFKRQHRTTTNRNCRQAERHASVYAGKDEDRGEHGPGPEAASHLLESEKVALQLGGRGGRGRGEDHELASTSSHR